MKNKLIPKIYKITYVILFYSLSFFLLQPMIAISDELPVAVPVDIAVVEAISSDYNIYNRYTKNKSKQHIYIKASPGEYEPFSFIIHARTDIENLIVDSGDLRFEQYSILGKNIDFKWVKYWYQANGAWKKIQRVKAAKKAVLVPELLLNDNDLVIVDHAIQQNYVNIKNGSKNVYIPLNFTNDKKIIVSRNISEFNVKDALKLKPIRLKKESYKQVWGTIKIPQNAKPGQYHGVVSVRYKGGVAKIPFTLEVFPFYLKKPLLEYSIYYRGILTNGEGTISSEKKNNVQLKAELINLLEHGISSPTLYQSLEPVSLLREHLKLRVDVGLSTDNLYYLGMLTGRSKNLKTLGILRKKVRFIKKIANEYGFKNIYVYGEDESRKSTELIGQKKAWDIVHKEGAKVFAAGYVGHFDIMQGLTDILVQHGKPSKDEAKKHHSKGKKIYSYSNPQIGVENPLVYRKNYGINLWQHDFDGAMDYAYQHSMGYIWNDFDHKLYRDHVFAYPTSNGVIDTIAWEGFREGVDDIRYLSTLLFLKGKLHSASGKKTIELAEKYIKTLKQNLDFTPANSRREIIEIILRICSQIKNSCMLK